jgi:thiamine transport system substrate-binding protein
MKQLFLLASVLLLAALPLFSAPGAEEEPGPDLVIYAYDSFVSEWGPAGKVIPKFEELYDVKVSLVSAGDAGQVLSRAIFERDNPRADILVGIDNNLLTRALEADVLLPYRSPDLKLLPKELIFDPSYHVTPFDYGYFAFVADSQVLSDFPAGLEELTDPRYRGKIILEDPRTSSPGLGFLLWTIAVYGDGYLDYWERLKPNLLTVTEGWDSAYGMFTSGEAPLVMSYTTSPAYHVEYEQTERFRALIFREGNYLQIEGMGIARGAKHPGLAKKFIDFILSEDFQEEIPLTNWMYPVNPSAQLPPSFDFAPQPATSLSLEPQVIRDNQEAWIRSWAELIRK